MYASFGLLVLGLTGLLSLATSDAGPVGKNAQASWAGDFEIDPAQLSSTGRNPYFVLEPGQYRVLRGGGEELVMTVLNKTRMVQGVETRVVEEHETANGKLTEISRNFFAIHRATQDVLYFGEEVDLYQNDKVVGHGGNWLAGRNRARAGLLMPGRAQVGFRHYQEQAPGVAMDRAEIVSTDATVRTHAGTFEHCVKVAETSPMSRGTEYKYYAPGVGLVKYESLDLVDYGTAEGSLLNKTERRP